MSRSPLTIVEVGPRDGFQSMAAVLPTSTKLDLINGLYRAGIRRMEVTAFVAVDAVPQLADAPAVLEHARTLPGLDVQVLVPNRRHATRALEAGAGHLAFVLSVSEKHNRSNVRRSPAESLSEYRSVVSQLPIGGKIRVNVATAFDCPYEGPVSPQATLRLVEELLEIRSDVEVCLCDTTGRATPDQVAELFATGRTRFTEVARWAFHGHDTYGLGVANTYAAWQVGIGVADASIAGLGGCPFAPGATGNVATEDLVWSYSKMGIATGIDLELLLASATRAAMLPSANAGGRVRDAMTGARRA